MPRERKVYGYQKSYYCGPSEFARARSLTCEQVLGGAHIGVIFGVLKDGIKLGSFVTGSHDRREIRDGLLGWLLDVGPGKLDDIIDSLPVARKVFGSGYSAMHEQDRALSMACLNALLALYDIARMRRRILRGAGRAA